MQPQEPGLVDPDEVANYVDGECHYLALAVHRLTGLAPVYIASRSPSGSLCVGHVAITLSDDIVADAEGVWRVPDLLAHWGATDIVPTSPEGILVELYDGETVSDYVLERIARAERLLETDEADFLQRLRDFSLEAGPAAAIGARRIA